MNRAQVRHGVLLVVGALAVALTAALGQWQLGRAQTKRALQATLDAARALPVIDARSLVTVADPASLMYRRVQARGQWVPEATVWLDNRTMQGRAGFWVLTPLRLEGSTEVVLVQRGWAPRDFQDRNRLPSVSTPPGIVTIEGRIAPQPSRLYELGSADRGFVRQNLVMSEFRAETRLPLLDWGLQQTDAASEGLLRQWADPNFGEGKHYGYAFQWFALSALIAGLTLWFRVVRPRLASRPEVA